MYSCTLMVTISQQMAVTGLEEEILLSNLYQASDELGQWACPECQLHLGDILFHKEAVLRKTHRELGCLKLCPCDISAVVV